MSIPTLEDCKKRKRAPRIYGFHSFANPGCPIAPVGSFRDNVRVFLRECSVPEGYSVEGMPVWCTFLAHESRGVLVPLYTIEESVKHSMRPFCDHCRCTGWSHHYVSKRRYHMIIPVDSDWNKPLEEGVVDLQTHLLHGMIHCNGFGHLLCINGIEGGSKYLCGRETMELWDRICTNLQVRKITVEDESKKRSMDLRLLHGIAYGHSWFGRWDYGFCRGSFGVTELQYDTAVEILSSLEVDKFILDFADTSQYKDLKHIVQYYRDLSETQLITIRDLVRFMLTLKFRVPFQRKIANPSNPTPYSSSSSRVMNRIKIHHKPVMKVNSPKCRKFCNIAPNLDSRWPVRRLEFTANVIVNALKEKNAGMTRQEARDAARLHIGDTGLIDYVLKSMNNVIVGGSVVRRSVNPSTRVLEYTIQETGSEVQVKEAEQETVPDPSPELALEPGNDVYADVGYLYDNVLMGYPDSDRVSWAVQVVLDSKRFVKEWPFKDEADELLRFVCRLIPSMTDLDSLMKRELPPGERVILPLHATVGELKEEMQNAMRDTYCVSEGLVLSSIEGGEELDDGEVLFSTFQSGTEVWIRGFGLAFEADLKYEGGSDDWIVRCKCGAADDDGERMVACDICEIWQHTRCCGIEDGVGVPPLFVCSGCCSSLMPSRNQSGFEMEGFGIPMLPLVEHMGLECSSY